MTRDYARPKRSANNRRNTRHQPSRNTTPGWIWLTVGIFVGAIGMKVYDHANLPAADKLVKTLAPPESDTRPTPKPRFDFYTLLTESEEVIPDTPSLVVADAKVKQEEKSEPSVAETPAEAVTTTTAPPEKTTKPKQVYVLQAGAFRKAEDADSVRARLLLLNLTASIEKVTIKPGDIWHRVLVGPFNDTQTLTEKRRILQSNGIDSIQVKRTL